MEKDLATTTGLQPRAGTSGILLVPSLCDAPARARPLACGTGGLHRKNACRTRPDRNDRAGNDRTGGARLRALALSGAPIIRDGRQVGVVTIGFYSPLNGHNIGIARMPVDCAVPGTPLTIRNPGGEIAATAQPMPFHDPEKKRRTAKG